MSCDYVLELGCGTGRFTRALIEAGIPEENLVCVEIDGELFNYLAGEFKKARVIRGNACDMMSIIPGELIGKIGVVVSGIPMINLPHVVQKAIVDGCMNVMRPRGEIIQFTYSPLASLNTSLLGLRKRKVATVFRNFPPATVWAYERAPSVNSL
ncbi:hypothetical protein HYD_6710 [Candidatus Hydrogenosomobacter endosymbioticus]|uniref:Methyltransferase domain-containing protein n=1 Tax=Candidatus Hydrogenosomobacter endosymbioticus TaxID=2558174 RepID=A0ABM7V9S1_9PROT|nr:hypothetical protein HYD_6710 [Candidatus Hydrogenosomobacter endosymbioticus]